MSFLLSFHPSPHRKGVISSSLLFSSSLGFSLIRNKMVEPLFGRIFMLSADVHSGQRSHIAAYFCI